MIEAKFVPNEMKIEINGHADFDEKGKDIVCSAMSILFYTLADSLTKSKGMLKEEPSINMHDGEGLIFCKPKEEYRANIELIYWTILNGIQLIAENYTENVKFLVEG